MVEAEKVAASSSRNKKMPRVTPEQSKCEHGSEPTNIIPDATMTSSSSQLPSPSPPTMYQAHEGPHFLRHGATSRAKNFAFEVFFSPIERNHKRSSKNKEKTREQNLPTRDHDEKDIGDNDETIEKEFEIKMADERTDESQKNEHTCVDPNCYICWLGQEELKKYGGKTLETGPKFVYLTDEEYAAALSYHPDEDDCSTEEPKTDAVANNIKDKTSNHPQLPLTDEEIQQIGKTMADDCGDIDADAINEGHRLLANIDDVDLSDLCDTEDYSDEEEETEFAEEYSNDCLKENPLKTEVKIVDNKEIESSDILPVQQSETSNMETSAPSRTEAVQASVNQVSETVRECSHCRDNIMTSEWAMLGKAAEELDSMYKAGTDLDFTQCATLLYSLDVDIPDYLNGDNTVGNLSSINNGNDVGEKIESESPALIPEYSTGCAMENLWKESKALEPILAFGRDLFSQYTLGRDRSFKERIRKSLANAEVNLDDDNVDDSICPTTNNGCDNDNGTGSALLCTTGCTVDCENDIKETVGECGGDNGKSGRGTPGRADDLNVQYNPKMGMNFEECEELLNSFDFDMDD